MKERGIIFSAPMVRALLEGRKTQTRRVVKPQPSRVGLLGPIVAERSIDCPYGQPGDRLWVRETWAYNGQASKNYGPKATRREAFVTYAADNQKRTIYFHEGQEILAPRQATPKQRDDEDDFDFEGRKGDYYRKYFHRWRPSIHMPRWASRLTLEITDVRVERLNDISAPKAVAEGIEPTVEGETDSWTNYITGCGEESPLDSFCSLWESIHGDGSWRANPWVWALTFKRFEQAAKRGAA